MLTVASGKTSGAISSPSMTRCELRHHDDPRRLPKFTLLVAQGAAHSGHPCHFGRTHSDVRFAYCIRHILVVEEDAIPRLEMDSCLARKLFQSMHIVQRDPGPGSPQ